VIRELEGFAHQKLIIPKLKQANFPLEAAKIKFAELDRLFNQTEVSNPQLL